MDTGIGLGLRLICSIISIINNLRDTPDFIRSVKEATERMRAQLELIPPVHIFGDNAIDYWIVNKKICNTILRQIRDLVQYYGRSFSTQMTFHVRKKRALSKLTKELEAHVQNLVSTTQA